MRVAIITLHKVFNYGSILQTYATQKTFEKLGHEVEVIDYITEQRTNKKLLTSVPSFIKDSIFHRYTYLGLKSISVFIKKYRFGKFMDRHINLTKDKYISCNDLSKNVPEADVYVTGSDQVWNSKYNQGIDRGFFLEFTPEHKKRISFAASFGKEQLAKEEIEETKKLIHRYDAISVREDSGIEILKDMGYEKGTCVVDPTLILSKEEWLKLSSKRIVKDKYLLLFLLYNEDNGATEYAKKIAKEKGLKIVKLSWELRKPKDIHYLMTHRKVEDFLSLINNADFIVTNSFHGLAFSINLNKEFIVVQRTEFNSRIESLLRLTELEERLVKNEFRIEVLENIIKYEKVNEILDYERKRAVTYIESSIY